MPRYYFHVMDSRAIPDTEGVELSGIPEAREQAIRTAGEILIQESDKFWQSSRWSMTVADEAGTTVFSLYFSADDHSPERVA